MSLFSRRPSAEDALKRLLILRYIHDYGMMATVIHHTSLPMDVSGSDDKAETYKLGDNVLATFGQDIQKDPLWSQFCESEKQFIRSPRERMTEQQQVNASWTLESIQILAWALGSVPRFPPYDEQADPSFMKSLEVLDLRSKLRTATLRPKEQIDLARDHAEFWHWRSRTRQLVEEDQPFSDPEYFAKQGFRSYDDIVRKCMTVPGEMPLPFKPINEDFPVFGKAYRDMTDEEWSSVRSITIERHKALNWLCGLAPKNRWDETPTPT